VTDDLLKAVRNLARLTALHNSRLLDTPPEEPYDRYTRLASRTLRVPTALISLVDEDRQFFKSAVGLAEPWASRRQMPLSYSFCKHVVQSGHALAVNDARLMPLVRDNPSVSELGVIAYAGMPLTTVDGHVLGTLCVIDDHARPWRTDELAVLRDLAACLMNEIELRRQVRALEQSHDG
jgi:GAF domain-containing protein